MPGTAVIRARRSSQRGEDGVIAIVVALFMTLLCVVAAMVLDFGLIKVDRQVHKSDADAAVLAGMHAMDFSGSSSAQPVRGVCAALQFLRASDARFSGLPLTSVADSGVPGVDCTDPTSPLMNQACSSASKATWAQYHATVDDGDSHFTVRIQNGYDFADAGNWSEDTLAASTGAGADHCMDMELTILETRQPGLGSLASTADLATGIRTVGRVAPGDGGDAPAMLLLKQSGCSPNALINGGSGSIHVLGVATTAGQHSGGTIHSDDNGDTCGTGGTNQVMYGRSAAGIVAYAAPSCPTCTTADPAKPGTISSVAGSVGKPMGWIVDAVANVYGASGIGPGAPGTATAPVGRSLVTRQPVDARYRSTVSSIMSAATGEFATTASPATEWQTTAACPGSGAVTVPAFVATKPNLWVTCANAKSFTGPGAALTGYTTVVFSGDLTSGGSTNISIPDATKVIVRGSITAGSALAMPKARKVYISNNASAASALSVGGSFTMHTAGRTGAGSFPDGSKCLASDIADADRTLLVTRTGDITATGLFRACDTTVVMMGGDDDASPGCLPTYNPTTTQGPAPSTTPCASTINSGKGTGQIKMNGDTDWTAPSRCTVTKATTCDGVTVSPGPWMNTNGPEDLALWSESYATDSGGTTSRLGGSSNVNVRGVYMTPNFDPMVFGGGGTLNLTNAQFISASLNLNGSTQLTMSVDPNSAVTLPRLTFVGLIR